MWLGQPLYIVCELAAAAAATAPYSLLDSTISDLGATTCTTIAYPYGDVPVCSPLHLLVNGAFVVFGLLMALGAVLLRGWFPRNASATTAIVLWVIAGLSSIATGLVPLDRDLNLHALVALPTFFAQALALLVTAYVLRRSGGPSRVALLAGVLSPVASSRSSRAPAALISVACWSGSRSGPVIWRCRSSPSSSCGSDLRRTPTGSRKPFADPAGIVAAPAVVATVPPAVEAAGTKWSRGQRGLRRSSGDGHRTRKSPSGASMHIFTRVRAALRSFSAITSSINHQPNPSESAYTTQLGQGFSGTRVF